ncbi:MAG TPA: alpha/beta family hydrolase [Vicinamibacterales bacterium]|nr:alpha/beta family hydrolase [Vicinamibacterales bacterium]
MGATSAAEMPGDLSNGASTRALVYRAQLQIHNPSALILAHGAGAGQQHPFMVSFARGLSARGLDVLTFNFLYMEQKRHVPDRMPQLVACYRAVMAAARQQVPNADKRLFIGGKSMGGRAATHVGADDPSLAIPGIVLLGYPLHPPAQPYKTRDAQLPNVKRPMLFVQGSRDTFGTPSELGPILDRLSPSPAIHIVHGGDHSFKVAGRDAKQKQAGIYEDVQDTIVKWILSI